jgi:lambda family phage portal protein
MSITSFLDAVAYAVSPEWGARRLAVRRIFEASTESANRYQNNSLEAAERDRLREGRWLGSRLSTDAFLDQDLERTRVNSRELYRNDFIGGAVDSRVEHFVGTGFTVQAKITAADGVITEDEADIYNQQLEDLYAQVSPIACRTRKRSLWAKTCLIARNLDVDGESLVVFSDVSHPDAPIPLIIEVIDVDRLETPPEKEGDPLCRMGIQYNAKKAITGYWIRKNHPNDDKEFGMEYDFVDASRVCHVFVEWFAGQSRGLPWMTRSLNRAKDGKDLSEAGIIAAQVEACYAVFIKSKANPLRKAVGAATGSDTASNRLQDVRPGSINYIGPDEEIQFSVPTKSNSVGSLQEYNNRTVAAGCNWPYEMLMKDWRGVSFAGGRIILHGAKITARCNQKLIQEMFLTQWWNRMVDEAVIVGAVDIDPRKYSENRFRFRAHSWTAPRFSYALTPGEEINAKVTAIDNNLATLADSLAEDQQDLEVVIKQRSKECEMERESDIIPSQRLIAQSQSAAMQPSGSSQDQSEPIAPQKREQNTQQESGATT